MLIYLDFDGVLHSVTRRNGSFEFLHAFETVLREYPQVEVVVSSSWRESATLDEMRDWFSDDVRHRIVGVTPVLAGQPRVAEVLAHRASSGRLDPFLVIDDAVDQFPENWESLLACNPNSGLDLAKRTELRLRLDKLLGGLPTVAHASRGLAAIQPRPEWPVVLRLC